MCEILKENFAEQFPSIELAIRNANFIAIDTEFTGLRLNEQLKSSLFDDASERYKKLRKTITQVTISQIGISLFSQDRNSENKYEAKTYNFYLFPRSFGPVDVRYVCQASSMEFMVKYEFDFNKFIYDGISHLNEEQERQVRQHIATRAMFTGLERDIDENAIQKICSAVADWVIESDEGASYVLEQKDMHGFKAYILNMELRVRFPTVWTALDGRNVVLEKVSMEKRLSLETEEASNRKVEEERVLENLLGFTRVFRVMKECKKPVIGHNSLMDMMLIYDKFYRPLPGSYSVFKEELHKVFPKIYDTKSIAHTLRRKMDDTTAIQYTSLGDLYKGLSSPAGRDVVIHPPDVVHAEGFDKYTGADHAHEAGCDAYMCGFVFLRFAHIITFKECPSTEVIPCLFRRYLQTTADYMNCINVIRGSVSHMCLDGPEPVSRRPELLYVRSRLFKHRLNMDQLAKWFSPYGSVDIKPHGHNRALVAAGSYKCAKDIVRAFRKDNRIYISKYSMWRHSPILRRLLWTGTVISGGICAWLFLSGNKDAKT